VHEESTEFYKTNFSVNTLGPLYLYQATYPLLIANRTADGTLPIPKFFITSSMVGSTGGVPAQYVNGSYGASKAAVNHIASAIHHQTEKAGAVVIPYHPGTPLLLPTIHAN
jgi:norsolorinic acid ketoreductase